MAGKSQVDELKKVANEFREIIDEKKIFRPDLGTGSLEKGFSKILDSILKKLDFFIEYAPNVSNQAVDNIKSLYISMREEINTQIQLNDSQFIGDKQNFLSKIAESLEAMKIYMPDFTAAAIQASGILDNKSLKKESDSILKKLKTESAKISAELTNKMNTLVETTKKQASEIETKARRTATHLSVKEAQNQFEEARKYYKTQSSIWGGISLALAVVFVLTLLYFLGKELEPDWNWRVTYFAVLRLSLLTTIATVFGITLRIFKANLHMMNLNYHRQRLTNSMEAFVESALTPEQRDTILVHLVDSIASFGDSGLLHSRNESIQPSKMIIDNVTRTIKSS